jgi:hypothetical protein
MKLGCFSSARALFGRISEDSKPEDQKALYPDNPSKNAHASLRLFLISPELRKQKCDSKDDGKNQRRSRRPTHRMNSFCDEILREAGIIGPVADWVIPQFGN